MRNIVRWIAALIGAVVGAYIVSLFGPGCVMNGIIGAAVGIPLGVFGAVLAIDQLTVGFCRHHIPGLLLSFVPNALLVVAGLYLLDSRVPYQLVVPTVLVGATASCLACYHVCEMLLRKKNTSF